MLDFLGWIGGILLALCGLPQMWQSIKDGHSRGITWGFLLMWYAGEWCILAYVWRSLDWPLLINYAANIVFISVILWYKLKPRDIIKA